MRPIWSGTLTFGLVAIPVRLYAATESGRKPHFRWLDSKTDTPIKEIRVNAETGKEVPWTQIANGVEYAKGKYIALSNDDLKSLPLPAVHTIELLGFPEAADIDPIFFDKPYYLAPEKGGDKPYELLRLALRESGRVGIGKVALRNREHLVAIVPREHVLLAHTLYFADEVRGEDSVPGLPRKPRLAATEEKMAKQLIASMALAFHPEQFKSDYQTALNELIAAKLHGKKLPAASGAGKVIDFQQALRESLERARGTKVRPRRAAG